MSDNLPSLPDKGVRSLVDQVHLDAIEHALAINDLSKLTTPQRISYYNAVCESVGLNPLTQPFAYIVLEGKLTLYARKECSEQLRKINRVSTQVLSKREIPGDLYEVNVRVTDSTGRIEEETGIVSLVDKYGKRLTGNNLANAQMKALTKAKRRGTLAISGLGLLDESEIETIRNVTTADNPQIPNPLEEAGAPPDMTASQAAEVIDQDPKDYICKIGKKFNGKRLGDCKREELESYVEWLRNSARERNQDLTGDFLEFTQQVDALFSTREVNPEAQEFEDEFH